MSKKIGLSLSRCISAICKGDVLLPDVKKIVTGTSARNDAEWEFIVKKYRENSWQKYPEEAEKIFRQLLAEGKIEQPRLKKGKKCPNTEKGIWVTSMKQIRWQ